VRQWLPDEGIAYAVVQAKELTPEVMHGQGMRTDPLSQTIWARCRHHMKDSCQQWRFMKTYLHFDSKDMFYDNPQLTTRT